MSRRNAPARPAADSPPTEPAGLGQLDNLLQHRSRLGALVLLINADAISFAHLKQALDETDGNLGAQLRKLEDGGYVQVKKEHQDRKPVSWYSITSIGRAKLKKHLAAMECLIRSAHR